MDISIPHNQRIKLDREALLQHIADCIYQASELQEILNTITQELRVFLGTDRVKIYKFHDNGCGRVVAESIYNNRLPSLLGLNFPASDIPEEARSMFVKAQMRSIVNVETKQIGQSVKLDAEFEKIQYRNLDPCHAEYLNAMGVMSSMVVAICNREHLWGLLVAHHCQSLVFTEEQLDTVQLVNKHLVAAIEQTNLLNQARLKSQREEFVNSLTTSLYSGSKIKLQTALEKIVNAFEGSGGRLYLQPQILAIENDSSANLKNRLKPSNRITLELYTCGMQPRMPENAQYSAIEQYSVWQTYFEEDERDIWAIDDLYQRSQLRTIQPTFQSTKIRSILILPLRYRRQIFGYLSIFRDEMETETLWAGQHDSDRRQQYPRLSFDVWREFNQHQVRYWTKDEIQLCRSLKSHLISAIQQDLVNQQLQTLLKARTQEREIELQVVEIQQQILSEIVTKTKAGICAIAILNYACEQLKRFFKADRVGVYRFNSDSQYNEGEFIAEDVLGFPSAMAVKVQDYCFGELYVERYSQGKFHLIENIDRAQIEDCHRAILELFQIKAHLVVPLMNKDRLWGLFCVHQCTHPRNWSESEIKFISRIAVQLSLAVEHSQLLGQIQPTQTVGKKDLQQILQELMTDNREIQGTALISDEGLPLAALFSESLDEEEISAVSVEMLSLAEKIGFELDRGNLTYVCVKGDKGYAFLAKCSARVVLSILTSLSVQQGLIVLELNRAIAQVQKNLQI
jgi:GAF domain-containing protein/predicted regulator of Ras-like GTPase activity (Roadblock/LC7/MglB family)